jgi:hypothetical protein
MPFNAALLRPSQDRHAGWFRAVVADNAHGLAALMYDGVEFARDTDTGERRIGD